MESDHEPGAHLSHDLSDDERGGAESAADSIAQPLLGKRADSATSAAEVETMPVWERRLTREAKLSRALVIVAVVTLALAVLLASTGIPQAAWQRATAKIHPTPTAKPISWFIPPQLPSYPSTTLTMTNWQSIPVPDSGRSQMSFTPFPSDPDSIFACTAARNIPGQGPLAGPVKLWRTHDTGQHWQLLSLPALTADTCIVRIASDAPQRILLLTYTSGDPALCQSTAVFVSEDGGDSWAAFNPPHLGGQSTNFGNCDAWATGSSLFWYEAATSCLPNQPAPCDELLRSADGGATWAHADNGLATTGYFSPVWTNEADQTLLAGYIPKSAPITATPSTALWISTDAGKSWHPFGSNFPHTALTRTYVSLDPGMPFDFGNGIYRELIGPQGTNLHNVAQSQSSIGQTWATLPPLPMPGADAYHDGIADVVGVTGEGALVVFGPDPKTGVALLGPNKVHDTPSADWLLVWNAGTWQWEAAPSPLPVLPEDAALSWGLGPMGHFYLSNGTWVWITSPSAKGTMLTRTFLPNQ